MSYNHELKAREILSNMAIHHSAMVCYVDNREDMSSSIAKIDNAVQGDRSLKCGLLTCPMNNDAKNSKFLFVFVHKASRFGTPGSLLHEDVAIREIKKLATDFKQESESIFIADFSFQPIQDKEWRVLTQNWAVEGNLKFHGFLIKTWKKYWESLGFTVRKDRICWTQTMFQFGNPEMVRVDDEWKYFMEEKKNKEIKGKLSYHGTKFAWEGDEIKIERKD